MNFVVLVGSYLLYNYHGKFGGRGVGGLEGAFERGGFPGLTPGDRFSNVPKLSEWHKSLRIS